MTNFRNVSKEALDVGSEVEAVRGVDAGSTLHTLLEKKLIRIAGHRDAPGRPMVYRTTQEFLVRFGLKDLDDLPNIGELKPRTVGDSS